MGLDIVELIMEIEDTFGITIPDNQYLDLQTVGHLHVSVILNVLDQMNRIHEENELFEAIQKLPPGTNINNLRSELESEQVIPENFQEFSDAIYIRLINIISEQSGVPAAEITPDKPIYQLFI